jgi:hypothetical protein
MRAQSSMELNRWVLHFRALRREEAEKLNTEIAPNPFNEALALAGLANRDGYSGSASATAPALPETAAAEHTRRYRVEQRGRTLQKIGMTNSRSGGPKPHQNRFVRAVPRSDVTGLVKPAPAPPVGIPDSGKRDPPLPPLGKAPPLQPGALHAQRARQARRAVRNVVRCMM